MLRVNNLFLAVIDGHLAFHRNFLACYIAKTLSINLLFFAFFIGN